MELRLLDACVAGNLSLVRCILREEDVYEGIDLNFHQVAGNLPALAKDLMGKRF